MVQIPCTFECKRIKLKKQLNIFKEIMTETNVDKPSSRRRKPSAIVPLESTQSSEALAVQEAPQIITKDSTIASAVQAAAAAVQAANANTALARSSVADVAVVIDERVETDGKLLGEKIAGQRNNTMLYALQYASEVSQDANFPDIAESFKQLYRG